jgi:hypothetical protein
MYSARVLQLFLLEHKATDVLFLNHETYTLHPNLAKTKRVYKEETRKPLRNSCKKIMPSDK